MGLALIAPRKGVEGTPRLCSVGPRTSCSRPGLDRFYPHEMTTGTPGIVRRPRGVLFVLPPDFAAPPGHLLFRFPPLGPAIVAACIAADGLVCRAVDLALEVFSPEPRSPSPLAENARLERFLAGARDEEVEGALHELFSMLEPHRQDADLVAFSVDRGSQATLVALMSIELKKRWGARIIVGGVSVEHIRILLERAGRYGADIVTRASTPAQLRHAFGVLCAMPEGRVGPPLEVNDEVVQLVRGGLRKAPSPDGWPIPDFSIYDLPRYRRDPVPLVLPSSPHYRGELGATLVLPYFFTFECQFSCSFCQTGGTQEHKPVRDAVRELAWLSERYETREFLFFDTQINLLAAELSRELLAARLDLRWSDSYRVRPCEPGDIELMARAGCAGLTIGVESASERVLKAMIKGHRPEHATEVIREAHRNEIMLRVNLLTCFPSETREELAMTRDWLRENAFAIDDIAPSSFYMTADSPVGRKPERFGVRVRGARALQGATRFRKSPDSLEYDEVDGMRWEEREPLLEASEAMMWDAWREGRGKDDPFGGLAPPVMLQLRRHFSSKADLYRSAVRWCHARAGGDRSLDVSRGVGAEVSAAALRPKLLAPLAPARPFLASFAAAYRAILGRSPGKFRLGDTLHALLFPGGEALFFRGEILRDRAGRVHSFLIEEPLEEPGGLAATEPRARLLTRGARLEARELGPPGAFEILSFRLDGPSIQQGRP